MPPVIEYLNQQESVHQFLASVMSLVDASVSNYQRRGFKTPDDLFWMHWRAASLRVSCGTTRKTLAWPSRSRGGDHHRELERMEAEHSLAEKAAR